MNSICLRSTLLWGAAGLFLIAQAHAGIPVWTFSAPNPAHMVVSEGVTATVQYTVTNQSSKPKNLLMKPISGLSASFCYLPGKGSTCNLTLTVNGSAIPSEGIHGGPVLCEQNNPNQCYQPSLVNLLNISKSKAGTANLQTSVSELALSVTDIEEYGVPAEGQSTASGVARILTITNTSSAAAVNVTYTFTPALPSGTSISPLSCGTVAPSGTCVLMITPGDTPSAAPGDMNPTPITLSISGDNTNTVSTAVHILAHGSVYQDGYVFAFDDTTPNTVSVGGKVVTTTDRALAGPDGIIWSSNGGVGTDPDNVSYDLLPGINETSSSSSGSPSYNDFEIFWGNTYNGMNPFTSSDFSACDGKLDGQCNTNNIWIFYNRLITHYDVNNPPPPKFDTTAGPTNPAYYAAGLCSGSFDNHSDWYLPAICEMGYTGSFGGDAGCGNSGAPVLQNIQASLIDKIGFSAPSGFYWSSTEYSSGSDSVWYENFASSGNGQARVVKDPRNGVRCVRGF